MYNDIWAKVRLGKVSFGEVMKNEDEFKLLLLEKLQNDFTFKVEVNGVNPIEQKQVRIDFLVKAKPHIISPGFTKEWFGIEVKHFTAGKHKNQQKVDRLFWQALTYAQSCFGEVRPKFILVFANTDDSLSDHRQIVGRFCVLGNVGTLSLYKKGYAIYFGSAFYFSNHCGVYSKGKSNAGQRRYFGNVAGEKTRHR